MSQALKIHHHLADVVLKTTEKVNATRLKQMIRSTLDQYLEEQRIPASIVHGDAKRRHGKAYQTSGYYLRLYRQRAELTQAELAEKVDILQHHVSEMEHNKRPVGKVAAQKFAKVLKCDYRRLL